MFPVIRLIRPPPNQVEGEQSSAGINANKLAGELQASHIDFFGFYVRFEFNISQK